MSPPALDPLITFFAGLAFFFITKTNRFLIILFLFLISKSWQENDDLSSNAADFLSNCLHGTVEKRMTTAELLGTQWLQSLSAPRSPVPKGSKDSVPQSAPESPQSDPDSAKLGGPTSDVEKSMPSESLEDALMASLSNKKT